MTDARTGLEFYYGLCVGGPMSGKNISRQQPSWKVKEFEPPSSGVCPPRPDDKIECTTFLYKHVRGLAGEVKLDFWVPYGRDAKWAILKVFNTFGETETRPK